MTVLATEHPQPVVADVRGAVTGRPRTWLRLEGLALLVVSLAAYRTTDEPWWLVPLTLLLPDVGAIGYVAGRRVGAATYNLTHATLLPLAVTGAGLVSHQPLAVALALVWLAHIGMDRFLCYGLKHDDDPGHTHLGMHGHRTHH